MKHTPGPWRMVYGPDPGTLTVVGPAFISWESCREKFPDEPFLVHAAKFTSKGKDACEADARLIAAAPEMFEMLKSLHSEECMKMTFPSRSCDLCNLIEKVVGKP